MPPPQTAPPSNDTLDLSAGIVTPPDQQGGDLDLSAGIVKPPIAKPSGGAAAEMKADVSAGRNPVVEAAKRDWEYIKGEGKGLLRSGAGLLDIANTPFIPSAVVNPGQKQELIPGVRKFTDNVRARTQPSNSDQELGNFIENMLEFIPFGAEEGPGVAAGVLKRYGLAADLAKLGKKYPKIAPVFNVLMDSAKGATRGAAEQGGQTYVKTGGDEAATAEAAKVGGAVGGGVGALTSVVGQAKDAVVKYAREVAPGLLKIGQTDFPLLASENPNATLRAKVSAKAVGQPHILEERQALVPQEVGNMSEGAIRRSLERSNTEARPPITGPTGDSAIGKPTERDFLEAHLRGHEAMTVDDSFAGLDPEEQTRIKNVIEGIKGRLSGMPNPAADYEALQQQLKGYKDAMKADTFDKLLPDIQKSVRDKAEALQLKLDAMPPPTKLSPQQQQLMDYQAIKGSRDFTKASPEYQDRINKNIDDLTEQLEKGNAWEPHDIDAAVARGRATPRQAGEALQAEHKPVYVAMDKANGGKLSLLHQRDTDLRTALKNVSSVEEIDNIRAAIKENDKLLDQMFEEPHAGIPKNVRKQARAGWRDGAAMQDLGDILEQYAYNGITPAESAASGNTLKRLFKGGDLLNKKLQALAEDRPEMAHLLGPDGITNLKQMGKLLETPESAYEASGLLGKLAKAFKSQRGRSKAVPASVLAYGPTHALTLAGAHSAAATIEGASNYITERLATDTEFNKQFSYAVNNKVNSAISIPLLMRRLTGNVLTMDEKKKGSSKATTPAERAKEADSSSPYVTKLSPEEEKGFQSWIKDNKIPSETASEKPDPTFSSPDNNYDMRGFYKDKVIGQGGDTRKVSKFDGLPHFPDTYKTPYHHTFSNESKYAPADAPHWEGDRLIDKTGKVIADETPKKGSK